MTTGGTVVHRGMKPEHEQHLLVDSWKDYTMHVYSRRLDGRWWVCVEIRPPVWRDVLPMVLVLWPDDLRESPHDFVDPVAMMEAQVLAKRQIDCILKTGQTEAVAPGSPGVVFDNRGHPPWKHN